MTITLEQVTEALEAAVAEKGADFVYPVEWRPGGDPNGICRYRRDGKPACIWGNAFARLGIEAREGQSAGSALYEADRNFPPTGQYAASTSQAVQDSVGSVAELGIFVDGEPVTDSTWGTVLKVWNAYKSTPVHF
jgi:hypothetical protein